METKLFDSKRDKGYPYFCEACLVGKTEMSPDPRYCQGCYEFLLKEAETLTERRITRRPDWIPSQPKQTTEKTARNEKKVVGDVSLIMSTLDNEKIEVDLIPPSPSKRGRKHKLLPEDQIRQLAGEGMGSKAIASRLKTERGIVVSYKTIQRLLSGKRTS